MLLKAKVKTAKSSSGFDLDLLVIHLWGMIPTNRTEMQVVDSAKIIGGKCMRAFLNSIRVRGSGIN